VSTEAPACITAPLETHQEPKVPSLKCLQEPSYAKILKDLCKQARKSRNHFPKKILRSKQFYIRWRNILPEGYEVLKKKGWKGLVRYQYDRGKCCKVFSYSLFSALHSTISFFPFSLLVLSFVFVSNSNLSFDVLFIYILLLVLLTGVLVFKFGGLPSLFTP
jgi:hypothetical protein